jgi:hypothetical protein
MKRLLLGTFALAFVAIACDNTSTSPAVADYSAVPKTDGVFGENPPPPPIDSGSVGYAQDSQGNILFTVNFNLTYFLDKPNNAGWLRFNRDDDETTDIANSAAIRMQGGLFSGKGIIKVFRSGDVLTIDLSKVNYDGTSFDTCPAPGSLEKGTCFGATLNGDGITLTTRDGAKLNPTFIIGPDRSRGECTITTTDTCLISSGD